MDGRSTLNITQAAQVLREKPQNVRYWIRTGRFPAIRPGGMEEKSSRTRLKVRADDVVAWARRSGWTEEEIAALIGDIDAIQRGVGTV